MGEALVKIEAEPAALERTALERPHPRAVIAQATEEANALAEVIDSRQLFAKIQGRKFVKVEGWVTLATLRGCLPREISVTEMEEGRYVAEVELIRMSDGVSLTKASAECGGPEDTIWQSRPPNARRSMAITRATGKACRVAFSWVMALAGYEVTPAEEMDHVEQGALRTENSATKHRPSAPPANTPADAPIWRGKLVKFETKEGTNKSGPWTLWRFYGNDGENFGTFSQTIADGLLALDGKFVEIVYETTPKGGKNVVEYRDVTAEEAPEL
jgi:hypothetical protein